MELHLLTFVVVATSVCIVEGQQSCKLPGTNGSGQCIELSQCPQLAGLLTKSNRTPQEVDLLRKAHCGFAGNKPRVCCPRPCSTPEGEVGQCVNVYSCTHIASRLASPPVSKETIAFVQSSRCEGLDSFSVCCGSEAVPGTCSPSMSAPDPRSECCGLESGAGNRIVGGEATGIDQYPWLVAIEYQKNNKIKLLCGGALISGRFVLTAGHCVAGQILGLGTPVNVRLGEYDTAHNGPDCVNVEGNGEDCTDGSLILPIEKTIPHPGYNPEHHLRRHDIALIKLASLAPYTDFIRPICLPVRDVTLNAPSGMKFWVAGWGATDEDHSSSNVKNHVDVPFKTETECTASYKTARRNLALWNGQMCAGGVKAKDSCKGDSGGPLMYENGKTFEVIGVVSFGPVPCGLENMPGVYTKVLEYDSWIRRNMI